MEGIRLAAGFLRSAWTSHESDSSNNARDNDAFSSADEGSNLDNGINGHVHEHGVSEVAEVEAGIGTGRKGERRKKTVRLAPPPHDAGQGSNGSVERNLNHNISVKRRAPPAPLAAEDLQALRAGLNNVSEGPTSVAATAAANDDHGDETSRNEVKRPPPVPVRKSANKEAIDRARQRLTPILQRKMRMSDAVKTKNMEDLNALLVEAINADRQDREESSRFYNREAALMLAVKTRDPHIVGPLVEKIGYVQYEDRNGDTALHVACQNGDTEILRLLLAKGVKVDLGKPNKRGKTPLMLAVLNEHVETVECLLDQKRVTSADLERSLDLAAGQGNVEIFRKLLHYAKSLLNADAYHKAMVTAAEYGHSGCLELLLKEEPVDVNYTAGNVSMTALSKCILKAQRVQDPSGHVACVELLLEKEADPGALDKMNSTPLRYAADAGNLEIIQLLLDYGASPDVADPLGNLPLHAAAWSGDEDCVQLLIARTTVNTMAKNAEGQTYLHVACQHAGLKCIEMILDEDPEIKADIQDNNGFTAVHYAAARGDDVMVNLLIDKDCYKVPGIKTKEDETPLHLAAGAKENPALINTLISQGESANSANVKGQTPLHIAVASGFEKNAWRLYESGAKLTIRDSAGNTPLRLMLQKMPQLVKKLLDGMVDTNSLDHDSKDLEVLFSYRHFACAESDEMNQVLEKATQSQRASFKAPRRSTSVRAPTKLSPLETKPSVSSFTFTERTRLMSDTATLMDFVHAGQQQLLAHPICRVFAQLKWHRYRKLWTAYLILNTVFVVSLSVFESVFHGYLDYNMIGNPSILVCPLRNYTSEEHPGQVILSDRFKLLFLSPEDREGNIDDWPMDWVFALCGLYQVSFITMYFSLALLAMLEILQVALYRLDYFKQLENFSQWLTFLMTFLTSPYPGSSTGFQLFQHHLSAFCVLLAWTQLMMFVGRSPGLGMYIAILRQMAIVFMQFVFIYIWIMIGSALALFILFVGSLDPETKDPPSYNPYDNPGKSFMKAVIMLTGEFDYVDAFSNKLPYEGTTHVIYLSFVMVITLILGNLLVALAVNELQKIQRQADIKRLVNMLELIAYVEYVIPYSKIVYSPTEDSEPFFRPNDRENRDKLYVAPRRGFLPSGFPWKSFSPFSNNLNHSSTVRSRVSVSPQLDRYAWIYVDKDVRAAAMKIVQTREHMETLKKKRSVFYDKSPSVISAPLSVQAVGASGSQLTFQQVETPIRKVLNIPGPGSGKDAADGEIYHPPHQPRPTSSPSYMSSASRRVGVTVSVGEFAGGDFHRNRPSSELLGPGWSPHSPPGASGTGKSAFKYSTRRQNSRQSDSTDAPSSVACCCGGPTILAACQNSIETLQARVDHMDSKLDYVIDRLDQMADQAYQRRRRSSNNSLCSNG